MKKSHYLVNKTMSGSCRVFPSRDSSLRELRGSPSKHVTHSWFALLTLLLSFVVFNSVSALTYQNDTNVDFTINPTISVSLSGDLLINDLVPGSYADSNIITVNATTNASHGYYLAATVGTSSTNTKLTHSGNSNYTFTNLTTNKAVLSNFDDNQWGYSYSTDNGSTWVSGSQGSTDTGYNGLPLDGNDSGATGITLIDTTSPVANSSVKFKIGAKASNTQPSGTYTNTINFYAVTHQTPITFNDAFASAGKEKLLGFYKMQDMNASICNAVEQGLTGILIDVRDNHTYYVAKLDDNKCWMTQNLNLAIGMNGTATLTSENTDLTVSGTGIYTTDYSTDGNGVITWTPTDPTLTGSPATISNYASGDPADSVSGWTNSTTVPKMAEGGTRYVVGTNVYQTRDACIAVNSAEICDHKHNGNFYNWTAAIASSASENISARYATAENSICPAGWHLPTGPNGTNGSEFNTMLSQADIANGIDNGSGSNNINVGYKPNGLTKLESSPYSFGQFGLVIGSTIYFVAVSGNYWSGSTVSASNAFYLDYRSGELYPAYRGARGFGWSVRCVAW